jgi:hypothetical protein
MTLQTLAKHAMTTLLAAITALSFAFPADAYYRGRPHGYVGHYNHGYYGHRAYGPRYYGPRHYGPRYYGPRHYGPRYYGYGPRYYGPGYYRHGYYGPRHGYYYHRNRAGAAVAAGVIGLTAATIAASQSRGCWNQTRRVYLHSGRPVWRSVRVCR